MTKHADLAV